ncbi:MULTISPECIES: phosphoribosyltransferase-like protein [Stutzerimonas stutzeri group]|uniref:phosphoribosyltransferase-like protein n=1 Tax=Stutzerimonas stutzeri group TaxID=136846 RepID=UPI0017A60A9B|nr:hypothetical protein [Stutzerimonas kunmingensis]MBA4689451.1 hypothetical protein [Pseudomonas sp.]
MISYKDLLEETNEYFTKVKQYARQQIDQKIWDSITSTDLDNWLSNFKSPEEKLLSAILLDAFIPRSAAQTTSVLTSAIERALPQAIYSNPQEVFEGTNFLEKFKSKNISNDIRIVPVIRNIDPPTKSGPSIARMFKRQLGINEKYMIWPWLIDEKIKEGVETFVFIDDVLATGQQASEFFESHKIDQYSEVTFSYIPLLAHSRGLERIKRDFPNIKICAVEQITPEDSLFNNEKFKKISDLEHLYISVAKKHQSERFLKKMAKGYDDLALTFSYYHATPNATLPLYWYESDVFNPLVKR